MSRVRPERRRRGDLVVGAALVVVALVGAAVLWWRSPVTDTTSVVAAAPIVAPPGQDRVPPGFVLSWRAPSAATRAPVVAGPAVVTADGYTVVGHDAQTGVEAWSYSRDVPLCVAGSGFPSANGGVGRVFALYRNEPAGDYCSEMTSLRPDTGARAAQRNSDARPGTSLLADAELVALTGADHAEVLRSPDLVRTLEFGEVPAPEQPGQQPRPGCRYGSFVFDAGRLGVVERCPDETTDRLTVLAAGGAESAERPESRFSTPLPGTGAVVVAVTPSRTAVAMPGPPRLVVVDDAGAEVATVPLDVPAGNLVADLHGATVPAASDARHRYWWDGTHTIALDATDLTPVWTLPGTLGAGVSYAGALLVPVPEGLAVVDPATGAIGRTISIVREDRDAPVVLATQNRVLLEQRGPELVALLPRG